jgi:Na+/phosphate symporter
MKEKHIFFNPFRIISPKLDAEASRLHEIFETPPPEVTCLEEGLLIMLNKLRESADLVHKALIIPDPQKLARSDTLDKEVHEEEKALTGSIVCYPHTTGPILRAVVLFPGKLERIGDFLESIANCARIRARDGLPFSDKAFAELTQLFNLFTEILKDFSDAILDPRRDLLENILTKEKALAQMTVDFALAHEERLIDGLCVPKASSIYLDILDSVKNSGEHLRSMAESLLSIIETGQQAAAS